MDAISKILSQRAVSIQFQPIVDYNDGVIMGYEALARGPANLHSPANLLAKAAQVGKLDEVEILCLSRALEEAKCLPVDTNIFINISPKILLKHHKQVIKFINSNKTANRVILELAENGLGEKAKNDLAALLNTIRRQGIKIALDDVGAGDRSFANICELPSDYLKIDRNIVQGLTRFKNGSAPHYFAALKALISIADELGSKVIAEGVETSMQLKTVMSAGINLIQGYYISRPKPANYWFEKEVTTC